LGVEGLVEVHLDLLFEVRVAVQVIHDSFLLF
jgi:hypothetical protein